jgi:hypothetical protein
MVMRRKKRNFDEFSGAAWPCRPPASPMRREAQIGEAAMSAPKKETL